MKLFNGGKNQRAAEDAGGAEPARQAEPGREAGAKPAQEPKPQARPDATAASGVSGEYAMDYEEDGVYLTLSCSRPLTAREQERFIRHLSRKKVRDADMGAVSAALSGQWVERALIAPPQQEFTYDEALSAAVSPDGMDATITMQPPERGVGRRLSREEILGELERSCRVVYGIDEDALEAFLDSPAYDLPVVIARGTPPVPGEDGYLQWHVDRREEGQDTYRVKEVGENEKIDYKNLDLFVQVEKDQLLVSRVPPKPGAPGRTVLGRDISAESGKNYTLPRGRNTYITPDGLELRASLPGRVEEVRGSVEVNTCYHVAGDVDMSVGNISFDGDIIVDGSVLNGFTLKATGSIEVRGIVEGSSLEAGRDVVIRGGIQGAGKGAIVAGGEVYAKFAEYAAIQAGRLVSVECLLHSHVSCFGAVEAIGGRGSVIGGSVCAGTYIVANHFGNNSGRPTDLEVGVSPSHRMKMAELEGAVKSLGKEVDKLQAYVDELSEGGGPKTEGEMRNRMDNVRKLLQKQKMMMDAQEELDELKGGMEEGDQGLVHALHTVHPGTSITIGLARMRVEQPVTYATFRNRGGAVEFVACRFKPQPMRSKKRRR